LLLVDFGELLIVQLDEEKKEVENSDESFRVLFSAFYVLL